ncbi:hypothetical protein GR210_09715 [Rhizobium leguminosarum]|uniref:metallophosphoesterase n=1 Tax=Rhizobium leguminosarum TaxID=384 RepID=UPI0013D9FE7E|nr:metallophosphoesterase [Rhizobium leguminosarum]MBY5312682.1 hypothetical protein [Rhizobium leguminosarum]NEH49071.1 hypothetical protein [Rhizobium leguminosarum]
MISILHISDLHRSPSEPVNNDSLIAALVADGDRYLGETPRVPPPCGIIVSGDIIQGARIGADGWREEMVSQYVTAKDFLCKLADRFLEGDRSQVVLIPGNHDVCWNTSRSAMEKAQTNEIGNDIPSLIEQRGSRYRWSWKDQSAYKITDNTLYLRKLDAYWEFVSDFYSGFSFPLPIDRARGFQLFELHKNSVLVAAFDSTYGNDCFGYSGDIEPGVVGRCSLAIRDLPRAYELKAAVWHHSIEGPPMRQDYMDVIHVKEMAGLGFQIGFHGHQHIGATQTRSVHLNEEHAMAVVSAGSLCAGARELPRGINRQYNMVVIEDDFRTSRVHAREMGEGGQFSRKTNGEFLTGYARVSWRAQENLGGQTVKPDEENTRRVILRAEELLKAGMAKCALGELMAIDITRSAYAKRLACDAALEAKEWETLKLLLSETASDEEVVWLIIASIETRDLAHAADLIKTHTELAKPVVQQLNDRLALAKMKAGK